MSKQDIPAMRNVMDVERKYGKTFAETMGLAADAKETAEDAVQRAEDINKDFTEEQGIYHKDGKWYINAELVKILMLSANDITTGKLNCDFLGGGVIRGQVIVNGDDSFSVSADGTLVAKNATIIGVLTCAEGSKMGGFETDGNSIFKGDWKKSQHISPEVFMCTGTTGEYRLGGSELIPGWCFGAGTKFGVTKEGEVYAQAIQASGGKVGAWEIKDGYLTYTKNVSIKLVAGTAIWEQKAYLEGDGIRVVLKYVSGNPVPAVKELDQKVYWYQLLGFNVASAFN